MISINCLLLGKTSFDDTFAVNVVDNNKIIDVCVNINNLKISDLKLLIWNKKKDTLGINDPDIMKLWKVDIAESEEDRLKEFEEDNIVGAELMKPNRMFNDYFKREELTQWNIHVIVQVPAAAGKRLPMFNRNLQLKKIP
ncbi:P-loop containing nucleoside triphosphate hydrolase protein [Rhizophagus irregularis DAOM 181602=DAOM 197198]|nr:P-loop containing nucleoside triphosphate hydrolase protein [Rhizophagus irregularis DAOM 181602=DAOM 197198]